METIAVFANDAAHARHLLQPMLGHAATTHWIIVVTRGKGGMLSCFSTSATIGTRPRPRSSSARPRVVAKTRKPRWSQRAATRWPK